MRFITDRIRRRERGKRQDRRRQGPSGVNSVRKAKEEHILPVRSVSYLSCSSSLPLLSSSSRSEESHNDLESAPAAAAIVCAGCTPDSLNQLLWLGGGGVVVGGLSARVREGRRGKRRESKHIHTRAHIHRHTHTHTHIPIQTQVIPSEEEDVELTWRATIWKGKGGRQREKRERRRGRKKKSAALSSPSCAFWGRELGGCPGRWRRQKSVPTVLPPCIFLIPSTHTQPLSFILLLKCAFIIQWNFIQQLRRGSLLNVSEQNCDGGI